MKRLFAFNVFVNGKIRKKTEERTLKGSLPTLPNYPKYVWAESEADALWKAKEYCDKRYKDLVDWKLISDNLDVEFNPVIVGESEFIEQMGEPTYMCGREFYRHYFVTLKQRYVGVDNSHDVVNPDERAEVQVASQDELAQALRSTFTVVN